MQKLKLQYFDHLMQRANLKEKTLMLGKIEGRKRKRRQQRRWLDSITNSNGYEFEQTPWRTEETGMLQSMGSQRVGHDLATE